MANKRQATKAEREEFLSGLGETPEDLAAKLKQHEKALAPFLKKVTPEALEAAYQYGLVRRRHNRMQRRVRRAEAEA